MSVIKDLSKLNSLFYFDTKSEKLVLNTSKDTLLLQTNCIYIKKKNINYLQFSQNRLNFGSVVVSSRAYGLS